MPQGEKIPLTFKNRLEYYDAVVKYRLQEFDVQIMAVREGMSLIVPTPLFSLVAYDFIEQIICGMSTVAVPLLKKIVRYREFDENHQQIQWLWEILENFSNEEKILFLRFVSGRSRLPANLSDISQKFQVRIQKKSRLCAESISF